MMMMMNQCKCLIRLRHKIGANRAANSEAMLKKNGGPLNQKKKCEDAPLAGPNIQPMTRRTS